MPSAKQKDIVSSDENNYLTASRLKTEELRKYCCHCDQRDTATNNHHD